MKKSAAGISELSVLVLALLSLAPVVRGQGGGQTVTGTVRDSSGAVVAGAQVIVTSVATGVEARLETNSEGLYVGPPGLPAGVDYSVEVSKAGFRTLVRKGVALHLGEIVHVNFTLTVGATTQVVTVRAAAPVLNAENPALGAAVIQKVVANLPLQDHRMGGLIGIGPGVYYQGEDVNSFTAPRFNMAGSTNEVLSVDGADDSQGRTNVDQMELNPPLDSVQEVQVQQSYYGAQYGGAEGGVVRITTKSGANQWHGSAYEYYRNAALDTRQFFSATRGPDNYNLFGGAVGGPIKKNRAFLFINVEGTDQSNPGAGAITVPTSAMMAGDFSALGTPIYNPATTAPDPTHPGQFIREPFPGNIIPQSSFDPVAVKALSFLPKLTTNGVNVPVSWSNNLTRHAWTDKFDVELTSNDHLSFTNLDDVSSLISTQLLQTNGTPVFSNVQAVPTPNEALSVQWSHAYIVSETHTFSADLVNTLHVALHRVSPAYTPAGQQPGWTSYFGLKNVIKPPDPAADLGFPQFNLTGYESIGPGVEVLNTAGIQGDWEGHDTLQLVHGKHMLAFGADVEHTFASVACGVNPTGTYNFNQQSTADPEGEIGGNSIASFMLGQVISGNISDCPTPSLYYHETYFAPYAQDDIHVSPHFTLDAGVRWEVDLPLYENLNRGNGFDPFAINPVSGTPGIITFQGEPGVSPGFYHTDWYRWEPRFGFAYELGNRTVIRGGYGIYGQTLALGTNRGAPTLGFQPVNASFSSTNVGVTPAFILQDGFPSYPIVTAADRTDGFGAVPVGQAPITGLSYLDPYWHLGYSQNFDLSVQRQLPGDMLLQVSGLGDLGRRLSMQVAENEVPPALWGLPGNSQVRRPFPQFGNITDVEDPEGTIDYYAGQAELSRQAAAGLVLLSSFTWQKEVGYANSFQSDYIHSLSRGDTLFNLSNGPQGLPLYLFKVAAVYDLPLGAGERYLNSGPAKWVLGGWIVGANLNVASGAPFGINTTFDSLNCQCGAGGRVDQVLGEVVKGPQTTSEWFNPSIAANPAFGQIGTMGISPPGLTGPALRDLDISLSKTTSFKERYSIKLSLDAFNVTNTPQFGMPGATLGTPSYDTISSAFGNGSGSAFSPPWDLARIMQAGLTFEW
jgi:hypothetical protein